MEIDHPPHSLSNRGGKGKKPGRGDPQYDHSAMPPLPRREVILRSGPLKRLSGGGDAREKGTPIKDLKEKALSGKIGRCEGEVCSSCGEGQFKRELGGD